MGARDSSHTADIPTPFPSKQDLVDVLSPGLERAIRAAGQSARTRDAFFVRFHPGPYGEPQRLPGGIAIGGESVRTLVGESGSKHPAFDAQGGNPWVGEKLERIGLEAFCDAQTLRACRLINAALASQYDDGSEAWGRAAAVLDSVADDLVEALQRDPPIVGRSEPFLSFVSIGDPHGADTGETRLRALAGSAVVQSWLDSMSPPKSAETLAIEAARTDRATLEAWLEARGVPEAARLAHDVATVGLRLENAWEVAPQRSRLGGPACLPPGEAWPRTTTGRPLSFLAALNFADFPRPVAGAEVLPDAGWLLFFVDLDDGGVAAGFVGGSTPNEPGGEAQVRWVAPGEDPVPAELVDELEGRPRIPHRLVTATPELTLMTGFGAYEEVGLTRAENEVYGEAAGTLRYIGGADDWVLGAATGVQGYGGEDGLLLLHLSSVEFQDSGSIQFRISPEALVARDWSAIEAIGESG